MNELLPQQGLKRHLNLQLKDRIENVICSEKILRLSKPDNYTNSDSQL